MTRAKSSRDSVPSAKTGRREALEKQWRAYAAGAGAAAAGLLAFSPPAAAEIVVTQAHAILFDSSTPFLIEIDGTTEFTLKIKGGDGLYYGRFVEIPSSGAGVVGHGRSNRLAALAFGAAIGTKDQFEAGTQTLAFGSTCRFCTDDANATWPFNNITNRFLGLKVQLNGQVHYGWAGFSKVTVYGGDLTAFLTAYAYEAEPNTPIYAGQSSDSSTESRLLPSSGRALKKATMQPGTLGILALGSVGLNIWRRREARETANS